MHTTSNIQVTNKGLLTRQIDEIGALDAEIAKLTAQRDELLGLYKDLGAASYAGKSFSLEITESDRKTVAYAAVIKSLGPAVPQSLLDENTKTSHVVSAKIRPLVK